MRIKNLEVNHNICLAPMAGVTDMPFRYICKQYGVGLVYTEMVSAKGIFYNNENTNLLLQIHENEHPVALQLFGRDPLLISEIIKKCDNDSIDLFDINMGCPAPKITKNGEGSALLKDPKLIGKIVREATNATKKPVTIKIRKGFTLEENNAVEVSKIAEGNGAAAITVHGRTREQFYSGIADWQVIKDVKEAVSIPVIGNGDVNSPETAIKLFSFTGCDAIMIGRAACGNPWIFEQINHFIETGKILPPPSLEERIKTIRLHSKMLLDCKGEHIASLEMRKHLAWYFKGTHGAAKLKTMVNTIQNMDQLEEILKDCLERN